MEDAESDNLDFLGPSDEEDEVGGSEEVLTPKEILDRLETGWINEKVCPEILPPLEDEKDAILQQLQVMEKNVMGLDKRDFRTDIHKLELERIKFVVVSYMRARLFKLQENAFYYYETEMKRRRGEECILMPQEFAFLKQFVERTEQYVRSTLLSKMPLPLQKFEPKKFRKHPHMDAHVFFRVKETMQVEVEDSHEQTHPVTLNEGEQHVMRYQPVAKLLAKDKIYLV